MWDRPDPEPTVELGMQRAWGCFSRGLKRGDQENSSHESDSKQEKEVCSWRGRKCETKCGDLWELGYISPRSTWTPSDVHCGREKISNLGNGDQWTSGLAAASASSSLVLLPPLVSCFVFVLF